MTHKQKVLRLLADRRPHSHHELYQLGCVAHSRISDLRKDGHLIRQWRDGDLYLYQLEAAQSSFAAPTGASPNPPHSSSPEASITSQNGGRDGDALTLWEVA